MRPWTTMAVGSAAGSAARRRFASALLVALVFTFAPASTAASAEDRRPVLVAQEGRVHQVDFPAIPHTYGPRPRAPTHAYPESARFHECEAFDHCAEAVLEIRRPRHLGDRDVLILIEMAWDPRSGSDLDAIVLLPDPQGRRSISGAPQYAGLVKRARAPNPPGRLELSLANPERSTYPLVVWPMDAPNPGFRVTTTLTVHDRVGDASTTTPAPRLGGATATAAEAPSARLGASPPPDQASAAIAGPAVAPLALARSAPLPRHHEPESDLTATVLLATAGTATVVGALVVGRRRRSRRASLRRLADLRLSVKLLAPFALLIVAIGTVGAAVTGRYLAARAEDELDQALAVAGGATDSFLRDHEFALLDAARYAANIEGVADAAAAGRRDDVLRALASVTAVHRSADVVAAIASDGTTLAEITREGPAIDTSRVTSWVGALPVARALRGATDATGDKHAGFVHVGGPRARLLVASPLRRGDAVVGAVVVATDASALALAAAERARAGVILYDGTGAVLASTSPSIARLRMPESAFDRPVRERSSVADRDVWVRYQPLALRGQPVGATAVVVPLGDTFGDVRTTALRLALLVTLGMGAAVALAMAVRRSVVRSVDALLDANRQLGSGNLAARAPVTANDELGELAAGFNQMAERLQSSVSELERRVDERTQELQRLYAESVAADEARRQFFAAVSHEFRTPLFAIRANTELLLDPELRPDDPNDIVECVETIEQSTERLIARVDELLALARAEAHADAGYEEVDLAQLVDDLRPMLAALARSKDVNLAVVSEPAVVAGDRERLAEVATNLVSNAVKYSAAGGSVEVSVASDDERVLLTVADTGIGIPPDVGDQVFEPYYRVAHTTAADRLGSSGLGLAVVKRAVSAHGGSVRHEPRDGGGTIFTVELPRRSP